MSDEVTEILFYHLERRPLEAVLPKLLEKSLERGWRVVVEAGSEERVAALDGHLWTYADDGFLPHGTADDFAADHPIVLLTGPANPNGARVRFYVDGAQPGDLSNLDRAVILFDGADEEQLARARALWRDMREKGLTPSYWRQDEVGRWENRG